MTDELVGACDTHVHFYDGRWPVAPTTVLTPPDAGLGEYQDVQDELGLDRVVVVQPTTYGLDNRCQLVAIARLGERARGVVVVDATTPNDELGRLEELGVRGARFHMLPGGAVPWDHLEAVAQRIGRLGWHVQLQLNGHELAGRRDQLLPLAPALVIDHVGRFMPPAAPDSAAFASLLGLVDAGARVKLSAPYESAPDPSQRFDAVSACVELLVAHSPDRMVWASNWPHPGQQDPPSTADLQSLIERWLPTPDLRRRILVDNPAQLYDF
jgi:D-galactarolactone isomerase